MNGGGFVKKRGAKWTAYYYTLDLAGTRRQRSKGGFGTKKEAQTYLTATLNRLQSGEFVEPTKLTFGYYLTERWLPLMRSTLRPSTWDSYSRMIELHVIPYLGE